MLSGSDWISNWSDDKDGVAEVRHPGSGDGSLHALDQGKTWLDPVAYPIDSGKWTPIDRPIKLKDVTIQSSNDYGTVMIVCSTTSR